MTAVVAPETAAAAAPKAVSWLDRVRAAKSVEASNAPATVIVAPAPANSATPSLNNNTDDPGILADLPDANKGTLVLDANAFIKGFDNFLNTADVFVTTSAVIDECKDRRTRDFLDRLPVKIEIIEPTAESVRRVVATAEKTGDIGVLSRTDLRLCALALDCARQRKAVGKEVVPKAPTVNSDEIDKPDEDGSGSDADASSDGSDGDESDDSGNWLDDTDSDDADDDATKQKKKEARAKKEKEAAAAAAAVAAEKDKAKAKAKETMPGWGEFDDDWGVPAKSTLTKSAQKRAARKANAESATAADGTAAGAQTTTAAAPAAAVAQAAAIATTTAASSTAAAAATATTTPAATAAAAVAAEPAPTQVEVMKANAYAGGYACVTSDFPMQNVLLHLGVPVVGSNGQCIHELRVWVLRCHACTCIVHDMTRQFCPECGSGDTLKRVHYVMNEKGETHLFINFRRPISIRGTIFNLSKPRGGRRGTNKTMVLREDQLRNAGRVDRKQQSATLRAALQEDGGAGGGGAEDGLRGFGDREGRAGRRDGNFMMEHSSYTRKNTNEARKVRASRKK